MRYDLKRDFTGWTVFDRWTGQVVALEGVERTGLARDEADALLWDLCRSPGEIAGGAILQHPGTPHSASWIDRFTSSDGPAA